jgi:flagellar hook-length control protein FliK
VVNLTSAKLPNRPGLGEVLSGESKSPSESPAPGAKGGARFADHLTQSEAKAKTVAPKPQAKEGPKADASLSRSRPDAKQLAPKDLRPSGQKGISVDNRPAAPTKSNKPANTAERESLSTLKDPRAAAEASTDVSTKTDKPTAKSKNSKVAGIGEKVASTKAEAKDIENSKGILVIQPEDLPSAEQAALGTVALDQTTDGDEPWEKRLEDMLSFMGINPSTLQQDLPSLAILTGQLQFVEPEAIPSTLAESPMLGNVLASADPAAIVEEVKPLGMWLDDLGWSPDGLVVKDPEAFQELMNTPVSLKDLMKTFEVDPDKIVAQAKALQESLPKEGAAGLIAQATTMRSDKSLPQHAAKKPAANPATENSMDAEFLTAILSAASMQGAMPAKAGETLSAPKPEHKASPAASLDQMLAALAGPAMNSGMEGMPKAMLTNQNPFQAMEMRATETFTFDAESLDDSPVMSRADSRDWLENLQAFTLQTDAASEMPSAEKGKGFDPSLILERLSEVTLGAAGDFQDSEGEGDSSFLDKGSDEGIPNFTAPTAHKAAQTFEIETPVVAKNEAPQQMNKAVFDNASMLVKEGGGAMRIDIGNKELGAIDLAVEVKDNQVDIKIVAASAHAREILATELPKLKENLQNQNLNLSKVEIGLNGGSSWTSSDGRSSQRESSSQREESFGVAGTGSRKSSRSYRQVSSTQNLQPQVIQDGGSIKVRV